MFAQRSFSARCASGLLFTCSMDMLAFLRENNLPFVVALTKADKLSRPKQTRQVELLSRQLEVPREQMLLTSAQTGLGIDELRHRIEKACD